MTPIAWSLASVLSPVQWTVLLLLMGAILMPRYIPTVARLAARTMRALRQPPPNRRPEHTDAPRLLGEHDPSLTGPNASPASLWVGALIAASAVAVLSWWLLRPR